MIGAASFKSPRISRIVSMNAGLGSFVFDLIFLEWISIGCVSVEGKIVWLISIMSFTGSWFSFFALEGCPIGSRAIKSCWVRSELSIARSWSLYLDFVRDIAFLVLSFIIKLSRVGLICVSRLMMGRFCGLSFVGFSVGRLQKTRVVVVFVERVATLTCSFDLNVIRLI